MKRYSFIIILFLISSCSKNSGLTFAKMSKEIAKDQVTQKLVNKVKNHFFRVRKKLGVQLEMDTIRFDTIFLLETFSFENGRTFGSLSIDHDFIHYAYFRDSFIYSDRSYFPKIMIDDLLKWDFSLERKGVEILFPINEVYFSRVIRVGDSLKVGTKRINLYDLVPGK